MARKEIWKLIVFGDYPTTKKYKISNQGRLMSFKYLPQKDGLILKLKNVKGYLGFGIKYYNTSFTFLIHKLVAENFCIQHNEEHNYVIHLDYDKHNNSSKNLKFVTYQEALAHRKKDPTRLNQAKLNILKSGKNGKVLSKEIVTSLKKELFDPERTITLKSLAQKYEISEMTLYRIKRGELWYTIRVKNEPKNKKYKLYKKVKKEKKAIKKRKKNATTK